MAKIFKPIRLNCSMCGYTGMVAHVSKSLDHLLKTCPSLKKGLAVKGKYETKN